MLKDLEIGDILVYPDKGVIGLFSNGIGHVSMVIEVGEIVKIGEAHLSSRDDNNKKVSGVFRKTFNTKWNVRQFRVKGGLAYEQKLLLVKCFEDEHEGKKNYNLASFPRLWFWGTILQPLGLGNLDPLFKNKHAENCGELIDNCYSCKKHLNIDLFPNMRDGVVTPGQFIRSIYLEEIV